RRPRPARGRAHLGHFRWRRLLFGRLPQRFPPRFLLPLDLAPPLPDVGARVPSELPSESPDGGVNALPFDPPPLPPLGFFAPCALLSSALSPPNRLPNPPGGSSGKSDPQPVVKYCCTMLTTLLTTQYITRPAGRLKVTPRNTSGINVIMRFIICCCGSLDGWVIMRCRTS